MTSKYEELFDLCNGDFQLVNKLETIVLNKLKELTDNDPKPFSGDYWVSKKINEGWYFHIANNDRSWRVVNISNYCDVFVDTSVLSLVASVMAFSEFAVQIEVDSLQSEIICLVRNLIHTASELLSAEELRIFHLLID